MTDSDVAAKWVRPIRENLLAQLSEELWSGISSGTVLSTTDLSAAADELLTAALSLRASDIHLTPYSDRILIRIRIDGVLLDVLQLPLAAGMQLIRHFKVMAGLDPSPAWQPLEARQSRRIGDLEVSLRIVCVPGAAGEKLAIRLLRPQQLIYGVEALGLCDPERRLIDQWLVGSTGMLLATGPSGSGTTTTICALLHELKATERSVVTIEDPIEYRIDGVTQMQVDEKHSLTFAEGMRVMLRLDADYLMLGEIRDAESAQVAVTASVTGRALMSTLNSRDVFSVVTAFRNWGIADYEIADCLGILISQRLVRKLCPYCRRLDVPTKAVAQWLTLLDLPVPMRTWNATGCPKCYQLGYLGRTGVFEVWHLTDAVRRLILKHTDEYELRQSLAATGHKPLLLNAVSMAVNGITSLDEVCGLRGLYLPPPGTPTARLLHEALNLGLPSTADFEKGKSSIATT